MNLQPALFSTRHCFFSIECENTWASRGEWEEVPELPALLMESFMGPKPGIGHLSRNHHQVDECRLAS